MDEKRGRRRRTDRTFEMGLGVIEVVRVLQEKSGDAKSSFDFEYGQEGDLALT